MPDETLSTQIGTDIATCARVPHLIHESKVSLIGTMPILDPAQDQPKSTVEDRCNRFAVAHHRALDLASWLEAGYSSQFFNGRFDPDDIAHDLRRCGQVLHFREYDCIAENRLYAAHFCQRPRICPLCAIRRAAKQLRAYCPKVLQQCIEQALTAYLVTFTVVNGPDLAERFEHLRNAMRKLHKWRRQWLAGGNAKVPFTEACKALGALWSYEIKKGRRSGLWHPHVHAVWLCAEEPDQAKLSATWQQITGDSCVVDVRPFHSMADISKLDAADAAQAIAADMVEVLKYALKFGDLTLEENWEAFLYLDNKRLLASMGELRGVHVDPGYADAPLELEDVPYVEAIATYIGGAYAIERVGNE